MANQSNILRSPNRDGEGSNALASSLKEWVKKYKSLTDIFMDAYCIVDSSNRVIDFNVAFTELCGESYRKILKIGDFCELIKTEFCPHQCPAKKVVASKKSLRIDELKGASKAFPQLQMIFSGIPLYSESQELIGCLLTIRNVSAESQLQKKYDERKIESVTDGLTRLYNKTFTEAAMLRAVKSNMREVKGFSLVMCDIDHFKKINDTHGHQAGDYVLALVAQIMKGEVRETDTVGRFGGEEFVVVLSNSDKEGTLIFAERLRERIASTKVLFEGKHIPVTVSVGTATCREVWTLETNPEREVRELVNKADTALYFAKAHGRNQARQFETLPQSSEEEKKIT